MENIKKKFVHIFEGEIVCKYQSEKPQIFGGKWVEGESFEVDSLLDLEAVELKGQDEEGNYLFAEKEKPVPSYEELRRQHYPDIFEYIDGIVKNDQSQIDAYIQKCKDVKAKFPKPKVK